MNANWIITSFVLIDDLMKAYGHQSHVNFKGFRFGGSEGFPKPHHLTPVLADPKNKINSASADKLAGSITVKRKENEATISSAARGN